MLNPEVYILTDTLETIIGVMNDSDTMCQIRLGWNDTVICGKYLFADESFTYTRSVDEDDGPQRCTFLINFIKPTLTVIYGEAKYTVALDESDEQIAHAFNSIRDASVYSFEVVRDFYTGLPYTTLIKRTAEQCGVTLHTQKDVYAVVDCLNNTPDFYYPSTKFLNAVITQLGECTPPRKITYKKSQGIFTLDFKPKETGA